VYDHRVGVHDEYANRGAKAKSTARLKSNQAIKRLAVVCNEAREHRGAHVLLNVFTAGSRDDRNPVPADVCTKTGEIV